MIGDGQVSFGDMVVKPNARKIRRVSNGRVIVGCAGTSIQLLKHSSQSSPFAISFLLSFLFTSSGSVADAFTLIDRLESKLDECGGVYD